MFLSNFFTRNLIISSKNRIVVAGIPRCGTTMVWRALSGLAPSEHTPKDKFVTDLSCLNLTQQSSFIIKTHSRAPDALPNDWRVIFLFGDPLLAVLSTRRKRYDKQHFANCGVSRDPATTNIFIEDALGYEKLYDSWMAHNGYNVICVRYESIFSNISIIEKFLGVRMKLPPKQRRSSALENVDDAILRDIRQTYRSLIKKVELAPDVSIFNYRRPNSIDIT